MRRLALCLFVVVLLFAGTAWAAPVRSVVEVYTPNLEVLANLATFAVGFEEPDRADWSRLLCAKQTVAELRQAGFEVEVLIDDLDAWVRARNEAMAAMPRPEAPVDVVLDHYLTHDEMTTFLYDLEAAYPTLMSVTVLGESVEGRELFEVKISDNVAVNEAEPAFYYEGTIHGDEIAGYSLALLTIEWLLENYGTDPTITALVNTREIFFEPLTNPDGNVDVAGWGRSRYNANGVDMNRNWGYMWDPNASPYPGAQVHSEPEVVAVSESWSGVQPYAMQISGHGGAVMFLYPWGYRFQNPEPIAEFDYLGSQYIYPGYCTDPDMDVYGVTSFSLYQAQGIAPDEALGSHGALGITFELSYDKECAWSKSYDIFVDHQPGLIWLWQEIGNGLHGLVTDADTGDPVQAIVDVDGKWFTFSDWEVGDYHKYLRAGTYTVRVQANGYEPFETTANIVNGTPTTLNIELTPAAEPAVFVTRWIYNRFPTSYDTTATPRAVFGLPDGEWISLGNNGFVILDFGPDGMTNAAGNDLVVYEGGSDGDENFQLWVSADSPHGPWTSLGIGVGTTEFDLGGLPWVRYVKVADIADVADGNPNGGFDLDAVGTPLYVAAFAGDPTSGQRPLEVNFTDHSTGGPTSWSWDFGDGDTSTEQNPTHIYDALGTYDVTLTIDGPGGTRSLTKTDYITVLELPPVAGFSGAPRQGPAPLEVTFTSESTGTIDTYAWDFGDGQSSNVADPVHTYQNKGNYTVTLSVYGPGGDDTVSRFWYIRVQPGGDDDDDDDDDNDDNDDNNDNDDDNDTSPDDDDDDNDDNNDDNDDETPGDDDESPDDDDNDDDDDSGCGC
jgi:PKD repeat protein